MSVVDNLPQPTALPSIKGAARTTDIVALPRFAPAPRTFDQAKVNSGTIVEPAPSVNHSAKPAPRVAEFERVTPQPANDPLSRIPARPYAQRPISRQSGLRLLPIESFVWGGTGRVPEARSRGDHALMLVEGGAMRLGLPARSDILDAGQLRFIPAGTAFSAMPLADLRGQVLLLSPAIVADSGAILPDGMVAGVLSDADRGALRMTMQALQAEAGHSDATSQMATRLHLGLIAVRLARLNTAAQPVPMALAPHAQPVDPRRVVEGFLELAGRELGRGRTVADLAAALNISAADLDRACVAQRGKRALDLIYDLRMDRAIAALHDRTRPIASIAAELGFASIGHFTRVFAAATGRLPEAYRASGR